MRPQIQSTKDKLRRDDGMTLVEMLVGISVGVVVIFAAYLAMQAALQMQVRTAGRVDAAQRGRAAMETITRDIRAQMCLPTNSGYTSASVPAMLWASGDALQFYSSVAPPAGTRSSPPATPGETQPPEMRRLEWIQTGTSLNARDSTAQPVGKIVETIWRPREARPPFTIPFPSYPNSPYRKQTIATDVEHVRTPAGVVLPIFRYYGYTVDGGVGRPSSTPLPLSNSTTDIYNTTGAPSVAANSRSAIVLIDIQFAARPYAQAATTGLATTPTRGTPVVHLFNRVSVRTADPTDPGVSPLCL